MGRKMRVGLIFGGRSVEHEVSLISARAIFEHLDSEKYEAVPIGVTRQGKWVTSDDVARLLEKGPEGGGTQECLLPGDPTTGGMLRRNRSGGADSVCRLDVIFPIVHGGLGEDGTLQGLLELAGLPYVGAGVMASAVGMDKDMMKRVFREAGLPVVPHRTLDRRSWEKDRNRWIADLPGNLGFPCFTKPANTGSSVGIAKARDVRGLAAGLDLAFRYDRKAVVEQAVDAREIECSVLGNDDPIASIPGEVIPIHEFYDYAAKYLEEGSRLVIPAEVPTATAEEVRRVAKAAFRAIDGAGMARVDFFLERGTDRLYLNEVNTIPGFTPISMYPKLWAASGIPYPELLDRLIMLALDRYREKVRSDTHFDPHAGRRPS